MCLALSAALVESQTQTPGAATDTTAAAPGTHLARPWQCIYVPAGTHCTTTKGGRECQESGPSCSSPTELKRRQSYGIPLLCAFFLSLILIVLVKADNAWWRRRVLASEIEAAKKQKEMPGANVDALNQQVAALEAAVRYI